MKTIAKKALKTLELFREEHPIGTPVTGLGLIAGVIALYTIFNSAILTAAGIAIGASLGVYLTYYDMNRVERRAIKEWFTTDVTVNEMNEKYFSNGDNQ